MNRLRFFRRYIVLLVGLAGDPHRRDRYVAVGGEQRGLPAHERPLVTVTEISAEATGVLGKDGQTAASPEAKKNPRRHRASRGF